MKRGRTRKCNSETNEMETQGNFLKLHLTKAAKKSCPRSVYFLEYEYSHSERMGKKGNYFAE